MAVPVLRTGCDNMTAIQLRTIAPSYMLSINSYNRCRYFTAKSRSRESKNYLRNSRAEHYCGCPRLALCPFGSLTPGRSCADRPWIGVPSASLVI